MNYSSSRFVIPSVCLSACLSFSLWHTLTDSRSCVWWAVQWTSLSAGFPSPSAQSRHTPRSADSNMLMSVSQLPSFCCFIPTAADLLHAAGLHQHVFSHLCFSIMHLINAPMQDAITVTMDACMFAEYLWDLSPWLLPCGAVRGWRINSVAGRKRAGNTIYI